MQSGAHSQQPEAVEATARRAASRTFDFHYRFRAKGFNDLKGVDRKGAVRVWLPCPSSSDEQEVTRMDATVPGALSEQTESRFGNRILYFETEFPKSGEFAAHVPYHITRHEVRRKPNPGNVEDPLQLDEKLRLKLLSADRLVPTTGKPLKLLESVPRRSDKFELARQLYDLVEGHVAYKKEGTGWGRGDTNWVCDSRYGNCTDFHSLFISLARSQGIPARFEIGFSIPTDRHSGPVTGYHCWAWFFIDGRGWIPVDISEADKQPKMKDYYFGSLTADRVTFSTGRDLELVPKPKGEPLNFFIYPYIEVGGQPLPQESIELQFSFSEQPADG